MSRQPKVIRNRFIPAKNFCAVTLFGVVFTRHKGCLDRYLLNHESIHCRQQLEWLYLPFFVLYVAEWLWYLLRYRDSRKAYRSISFEREAYDHQNDLNYLSGRPCYANYRRSVRRSM